MNEFLTILIIGIALSMDAFSIALSMGTLGNLHKNKIFLSTSVGIMHFIMPLLGLRLGTFVITEYNLNPSFIAGLILIILGLKSLIEIFKKDFKEIELNIIGVFLFAFSVSVDSFSTGIGLNAITSNHLLSFIIFSFCSATFTYLGLILGKYLKNRLNNYANIIGIAILITMGLIYLCK